MGFIDAKIHLLWQSLAAHSKEANFPWDHEIHRTRLQGIAWQMNLLSIIKTVMHHYLPTTWNILAE